MSQRFEGKTVFITGASSGIGAALGRAFAEEGANVALAARRADRLEIVRGTVEAAGAKALALQCDVTDRASIDAAIEETVHAFGGLDVVVANAGFGVSGLFERLSTGDFRRQFDTNVFGVIDTIYAALPHLIASKGRVGVVASVMGRIGSPTTSPYCASKFALVGLCESLYFELADRGVSVTCINPGLVESNIRRVDNRNVFKESRPEPAAKWLIMPARKAARQIVKAIHRRKPEAVITGHGKLAVWFSRHFPRSLRFIMRQMTRGRSEQVQRAKRGAPPQT